MAHEQGSESDTSEAAAQEHEEEEEEPRHLRECLSLLNHIPLTTRKRKKPIEEVERDRVIWLVIVSLIDCVVVCASVVVVVERAGLEGGQEGMAHWFIVRRHRMRERCSCATARPSRPSAVAAARCSRHL